MAMQYELELLGRSEAFRANFAKKSPNHPDLGFMDADIVARKARIALLSRIQISPSEQSQKAQPEAVEQPLHMIPEGEGVKFIQNIGGKSAEQLEVEVEATGREITTYASDMLHSPKFGVLEKVTPQKLLKAPVRAFGLPGIPTIRELFERIPQCRYGEEYALELPRAEVGPHMAIADENQAKDDDYYVMHQPIAGRSGYPRVFQVRHLSIGRFLHGRWASPYNRWFPDDQLVVALRKIEPVKS